MNQPLTEIEVEQMLNRASEHEVNPWIIALAVGGWMWAAIWFVAFVASVIA